MNEIERLRAEVESLQPQHHYMTKYGAELQSEVARLHGKENEIRRTAFLDAAKMADNFKLSAEARREAGRQLSRVDGAVAQTQQGIGSLLRRAAEGVKAVDIDAWSKRLAGDVADATD